MISAAALANFQNMVAKQFDQTCQIQRQTNTSDGFMHNAPTWATAPGGAAVPCQVAHPTGTVTAPIGSELSGANTSTLTVSVGTNIQTGDRVLLPGLLGGTSVYHVQAVRNSQSLPVAWDVEMLFIEGTIEDGV